MEGMNVSLKSKINEVCININIRKFTQTEYDSSMYTQQYFTLDCRYNTDKR